MRPDLKLHIVAGAAIALASGIFLNPLDAVLLSCLIGVGKEVFWDWLLKKGTPAVDDCVYTCVAAQAGWVWALA